MTRTEIRARVYEEAAGHLYSLELFSDFDEEDWPAVEAELNNIRRLLLSRAQYARRPRPRKHQESGLEWSLKRYQERLARNGLEL